MAINTTPVDDGYDLADTKRRVKAILVGSMGNLIEWYDVYAFTAFALYFGKSFFTGLDPVVVQRNAAIVFALGFIMRPAGSLLFGWLADRYGRRSALLYSVLLMCFGSLLIACAPTANEVGVLAPAILLLARILQGLSQGGEYGASATYLSEMSHPNRRGFYSGIWYVTLIGGQLMAILTLLILQKLFLTEEQLYAWGWRIPFVIGALIAIYATYMRRDMHETDHYKAASAVVEKENPLKLMLKHWRMLIVVVGFTVGGTSAFYTYTTYMQKFLALTVKLDKDTVTLVTFCSLVVAVILQPIYGAISDKIGRKPLLLFFGICGTLGTYPLLTALSQTKSAWTAFFIIVIAWCIVSGYTSITAVVKTEMFPTSVRALGVGVPYALTAALFGGTTDSVALSFKDAGHEEWFYIYASALIFISLCVYVWLKDTKTHSRMEQHV